MWTTAGVVSRMVVVLEFCDARDRTLLWALERHCQPRHEARRSSRPQIGLRGHADKGAAVLLQWMTLITASESTNPFRNDVLGHGTLCFPQAANTRAATELLGVQLAILCQYSDGRTRWGSLRSSEEPSEASAVQSDLYQHRLWLGDSGSWEDILVRPRMPPGRR